MYSSIIGTLGEIPKDAWNRLAGHDYPFTRHEFLNALEQTGCLAPYGWTPQHVAVYDDRHTLIGAAPLYLKSNSYGELVFDWAWAEAYQRHGLAYYPKLVGAIPYTPATGPRLLVDPEHPEPAHIRTAIIAAALEHAQRLQVSSVHWLFTYATDDDALLAHGFMPRLGCQFHWQNAGYTDFDHFLAQLSADKRKKIKRERRRVQEADIQMHTLHGDELTEAQWQDFHRHYRSTYDRLGGHATLSLDFFRTLARELPRSVVIVMASHQGRNVASAFCMRGATILYGRHWGCDADFHSLHFETCYYQGLDYCIRHGLAYFDPGAQGEHKISRGFLPTPTRSMHWIADPEFRRAIADFLVRERSHMEQSIEELSAHAPYREVLT